MRACSGINNTDIFRIQQRRCGNWVISLNFSIRHGPDKYLYFKAPNIWGKLCRIKVKVFLNDSHARITIPVSFDSEIE